MADRMAGPLAGALALALMLQGCSVRGGPALDRAEIPAAPDNWAARPDMETADIAFPDGWVGQFADADLSAAIATAFARNRSLQSVLAQLRAARAAGRIDRADLFPRIDFSASASDAEGNPALYQGNVTASWEVDIWGRNLANARAGNAEYRAAAADYAAARQALAASVAQAWYDRAAARESQQLAERDLETRNDTLRITDARFRAGLASRLDVRLAQVAVSNSEDRLQATLRASDNAARRLEVLTGQYPEGEAQGASALVAPSPLPVTRLPAAVLAGRPDLVAAEARVDAAGLRAVDARHAMFPQLTLSLGADSQSGDIGDVFNPSRYLTAIAGGLLQPLFRGGALLAEADRRGEIAQAALFDYAEAALTAFQEVEDRLDAEATLARQVEVTGIAADEARKAVGLTRSRYVNGRSTIFDLLNAQSGAIAAEIRAVEARRARIENRIALHLAMGSEPFAAQ
ncbi:MAG: efflux transporter outer membrane subunit [Blastomonas sp.]